MLEHPAFGAGVGPEANNDEWTKLKEDLDKLGPKRSVGQWKIVR